MKHYHRYMTKNQPSVTYHPAAEALPDLAGLVHGFKSREPWTIQCDKCLWTAQGKSLALVVLTGGYNFEPRAYDAGDHRRLCPACALEEWAPIAPQYVLRDLKDAASHYETKLAEQGAHEHEYARNGYCHDCGATQPDYEPDDTHIPALAANTD